MAFWCWHKWSKWERAGDIQTKKVWMKEESDWTHIGYVQIRTCEKCGKSETHKVMI